MSYRMDFSDEPDKKKLLPEGWRRFQITQCIESISKAGNQMFQFKLKDIETEQVEEVFAIATQGKRWFLKSILKACDVKAGQDGIYEWDIENVLDKIIAGRVQHINESWINREGESIAAKKAKIVEIDSVKSLLLQEPEINDIIENYDLEG